MAEIQGTDPMGCEADLRELFRMPELAELEQPGPYSQTAELIAFRIALAFGRSRLFGVTLPKEVDGDLDDRMVAAATNAARRSVEDRCRLAAQLVQEPPLPTIEEQEAAFRLLEARMNLWAAFIAVDDAVESYAAERSPLLPQVEVARDEWCELIGRLDVAMRSVQDHLAIAAQSELLKNWRGGLADEFRDNLPWWLDGQLERRYHDIAAKADQTIAAYRPNKNGGNS